MIGLYRKLFYCFHASYRRKMLDKILCKHISLYKGIVLDIGGRAKGKFRRPKNNIKKWIFADIEKKHNPDIIIDVANMTAIENESIDVINAIELFEHVKLIEKGLSECFRVLKKNGLFIISAPFLSPIHADPCDYQRWTINKWEHSLEKNGFLIEKVEIMGNFFTVLADMIKVFIKSLPLFIRSFGYLLLPFLALLTKIDKLRIIQKNLLLNKYTTGYFIIARKK